MRLCSSCQHPERAELDRRLRSGSTLPDIHRWSKDHPPVLSVSALSRHRADHLGVVGSVSGPRPRSTSFLRDVVDTAHDDLTAGALRPSIRDAIASQAEINRQGERQADRELLLRIGALFVVRPSSIEEGTFREVPDGTTAFSPERTRQLADLNPRRAGE